MMCLPAYDLVCDKCRAKFDALYGKEKPKSVEEERRLYLRWIKVLCKDCRKILREEGYI